MTLQTPRKGGLTETVVIPNGTTRRIDQDGNYLRCVTSTANLTFRIDNTGNPLLFNNGKWYRSEPGDSFQTIELSNTSGAAVTVTYFIGWGTYGDDSLSGTIQTTETAASAITDSADNTVAAAGTLAIAANASRRLLIIQNLSTLYSLRVGSAPGAARGFKLAPEATVTLATASAVNVYNTGAAAADVAVLELT